LVAFPLNQVGWIAAPRPEITAKPGCPASPFVNDNPRPPSALAASAGKAPPSDALFPTALPLVEKPRNASAGSIHAPAISDRLGAATGRGCSLELVANCAGWFCGLPPSSTCRP